MVASRNALIIAADRYEDPQLRRLRAPGLDAQALAAVLGDPAVGGFAVEIAMNRRHYEVRLALEEFFAERRRDDVLLLHFSCHGIKDEAGRLYFAAADTRRDRLNATGIAAEFVGELLSQTRSRQVVVLIDCCFSGAFTRGMLARGDQGVDLAERLQGHGRAVLTASSALEYAWEGDAVAKLEQPSIFTSAVVRGLQTGEADRDGDLLISVDDLYEYVYDQVRRATPNQTPGKWSSVEGMLVIARNAHAAPRPDPPPEPEEPAQPALRAVPAPPTAAATAQRATDRAAWLPALIVGGGWALAWLVCFALASSAWVEDMISAVLLVLIGWLVTAPLVSAALRWASPDAARRVLLIAVGWPVCLAVGLAAPIALRLGYEGAALLGIGVAAAGLLGAIAAAPGGAPLPWERIMVVTVGWCAGWLWSGAAAWPLAFWRLTHGYASTFADLVGDVGFPPLAAGGLLSGLFGGLLIAAVLRPRLQPG